MIWHTLGRNKRQTWGYRRRGRQPMREQTTPQREKSKPSTAFWNQTALSPCTPWLRLFLLIVFLAVWLTFSLVTNQTGVDMIWNCCLTVSRSICLYSKVCFNATLASIYLVIVVVIFAYFIHIQWVSKHLCLHYNPAWFISFMTSLFCISAPMCLNFSISYTSVYMIQSIKNTTLISDTYLFCCVFLCWYWLYYLVIWCP